VNGWLGGWMGALILILGTKKKKSEYPAAIFECQDRLLLGLGHDHFGIRKVIKTLHSQLGVEFYIKWIVASREIKRMKSIK